MSLITFAKYLWLTVKTVKIKIPYEQKYSIETSDRKGEVFPDNT